jgi:4-amino-4-deoxychorismate lyase
MKRVLLSGKPFAEPLPEGFLYHGYSVFTTLRAEGGRPLWLPDHLARLRRHAEALGLSYPGDEAFLQDLKVLLAAFPQAPCLRLRLTVGEGVWLSEARPYAPLPRALYREGVRVHLTPYRVHPDLFPYKTGNYLPYRLALEEAKGGAPLRASSWTRRGTWWTGAAPAPCFFGRAPSTSWRGASRASPGRRWPRRPGSLG